MRLPLLLLLGLSSACFAKDATIQSPNGNITITISDQQATPSYKISFNGKDVIENSALGFEFKQQAAFAEGFTITDVNNSQHNSQWQQPWGERQTIIDKHNELAVTFKKPAPQGGTYTVRFRAFNDGVGFRYEVPKQAGFENIEITKELTEFAISGADKATAWWIPARGWNRYEYVYNTTPLQQAALAHTPFTFKNADGVHVSIHEAALVDYAGMVLNQRRPGTLQADLTPCG